MHACLKRAIRSEGLQVSDLMQQRYSPNVA